MGGSRGVASDRHSENGTSEDLSPVLCASQEELESFCLFLLHLVQKWLLGTVLSTSLKNEQKLGAIEPWSFLSIFSVFVLVSYLIVVQGHSLSVMLCPGLTSVGIQILGQSGLSGSELTALLERAWQLRCRVHPCQQFEINTGYKNQTQVSRPMPAQPREAHRQHFL